MPSRFLDYLRLFRLPNAFTAVADVLMGFLVVQGSFQPTRALVPLITASCLLYTAGMVLNDVFDVEIDRAERPSRPLPAGRIEVAWALRLGLGMLGLGVLLAVLVGPQSGAIAAVLALCVYAYDGPLKATPVAPLVMGSCRMLNVLLGMSLAATLLQRDYLAIAGGLGVYVAGITWFARSEARAAHRATLLVGAAVMLLGAIVLASAGWLRPDALKLRSPGGWPAECVWSAFLGLILLGVARHCVIACLQPTPQHVQRAVKQAILALVVLDAAVVLAFVGPWPAIAVVALLVPATFLGRWVYST